MKRKRSFTFNDDQLSVLKRLRFNDSRGKIIDFHLSAELRTRFIDELELAFSRFVSFDIALREHVDDSNTRLNVTDELKLLSRALIKAQSLTVFSEDSKYFAFKRALALGYNPEFSLNKSKLDADAAERGRQVEMFFTILRSMSEWVSSVATAETARSSGKTADPTFYLLLDDLTDLLSSIDVPIRRAATIEQQKHSRLYVFLVTMSRWVRPHVSYTSIDSYLKLRKGSGSTWAETERLPPL